MKVEISRIKVGERFRRDAGALEPLAESIKENGLLHPIVLTSDYNLIAGFRRLRAAELLGWTEIEASVVDVDDPLGAEAAENAERLALAPSEAVALAEALEASVREQGKARQLAGLRHGQAAPPNGRTGQQGETRDLLAAKVGMGATTLRKVWQVVEWAREDPDFEPFVAEMDRTRKVNHAYEQALELYNAKKQAAGLPADPDRVATWEAGQVTQRQSTERQVRAERRKKERLAIVQAYGLPVWDGLGTCNYLERFTSAVWFILTRKSRISQKEAAYIRSLCEAVLKKLTGEVKP